MSFFPPLLRGQNRFAYDRQVPEYIEWFLCGVLHAVIHFQYAQGFSANENVIAVFSRLIATAAPKSQCQGWELGMAR